MPSRERKTVDWGAGLTRVERAALEYNRKLEELGQAIAAATHWMRQLSRTSAGVSAEKWAGQLEAAHLAAVEGAHALLGAVGRRPPLAACTCPLEPTTGHRRGPHAPDCPRSHYQEGA